MLFQSLFIAWIFELADFFPLNTSVSYPIRQMKHSAFLLPIKIFFTATVSYLEHVIPSRDEYPPFKMLNIFYSRGAGKPLSRYTGWRNFAMAAAGGLLRKGSFLLSRFILNSVSLEWNRDRCRTRSEVRLSKRNYKYFDEADGQATPSGPKLVPPRANHSKPPPRAAETWQRSVQHGRCNPKGPLCGSHVRAEADKKGNTMKLIRIKNTCDGIELSDVLCHVGRKKWSR